MPLSCNNPFPVLMGQLRDGDEDAAAEVHRRFVRRLVGLAVRQLDGRLVARAEPEDVVQSAFRSFFRRYRQGQYDFGDWGAVWGMLAVITVHKCAKRRAFWRAGRRDDRREIAWDDAGATRIVVDRMPSAFEAAMLSTITAAWLASLRPSERSVIELGLQGLPDPEIALQLFRSERSVRRIRQQAEASLRKLLEMGDNAGEHRGRRDALQG